MDKSRTTEGGHGIGDVNMSMGGFEMQRMLRQNANEKAFEIAILG